MRVLIACEFSGTVRSAFAALGHEAYSCDLLPSEKTGNHYQCSVLDVLHLGWDLVVGHPPCTYLCNSGVRWLSIGGTINQQRYQHMKSGCDLFAAIYKSPVKMVAIENPVMHKFAREYLQNHHQIPTHTQTIQPYQFGHGESKRTCLWLRGLPNLTPTNEVEGREQRIWKLPPSEHRWKERSRTFQGIADAMANQWGNAVSP